MPGNNAEPNFTQYLEELERRIRALESAPRQRRTGQVAGVYKILDTDNNERIEMGEIIHPFTNPTNQTDFGIIVRTDDDPDHGNEPVFIVDSGGPLIPGDKGFIQAVGPAVEQSHSSTSYTTSWNCWFVGVLGRVFSVSLQIRVGTGITAADARIQIFESQNNFASDAIALVADNAYRTYTWHWNIGEDTNPDDVWAAQIQTRVTTGAGQIDVVQPRWAVQRSEVAIDTNVTGLN